MPFSATVAKPDYSDQSLQQSQDNQAAGSKSFELHTSQNATASADCVNNMAPQIEK